MSTRLCWLGHACLLLESDGKRVLIDPFLTGNPAAAMTAEEVPADFILVSHGHGDHVGDTIDDRQTHRRARWWPTTRSASGCRPRAWRKSTVSSTAAATATRSAG